MRSRLLPILRCLLLFAATSFTSAAHAAPELLLAQLYRSAIDPADYLVSEKYDGARALWDGTELRFRSGNRVHAPAWFTAALPAQALDGELWAGRGRFERLMQILRHEPPDDAAWQEVRFMVFELPEAPGSFAERAQQIEQIAARAAVPWLQAVPQQRIASRAELQRRLRATLAGGGEGLMLHRADAPYQTGRSDVLLKLKPWLDAEARVLAHLPGKGQHAGRTGALLVELADGRRLRLGSGLSDKERREPPAIGSEVSFRYRSLTASGLPRHAVYLRERPAL